MRRLALAVLLLAVTGCSDGGTDAGRPGSSSNDEITVTAPEWATPFLTKKGAEGAAVMASSDFAVGRNRVTFLLVRDDSSLVRARIADVYFRPDPNGPTRRAVARLTSIGVKASPAEQDEAKEIYIANLRLPRSGKHWIIIQPRNVAFQGFQILDVKKRPTAIAIGETAPLSNNPTLATSPADRITTARPPDVGLLRYSVAESIQSRRPFVLVFSTPAFCESRTCGPALDVLNAVRERFEAQGVRFIHIEIYQDNLPGNGPNRWVKEWKLPTEPWVFVVDTNGVVRDRFEGAVAVPELVESVRRHLLR